MEQILYILSIALYGFGNLNGYLPLTLTMSIIFLLFFLQIYKISLKKRIIKIHLYIMLFFLVIYISLLINIYELTFKELFLNIKFIIYFIIYFIVSIYILRKDNMKKFIKYYIIFGILISIIGILQYLLAYIGIDIGVSNSKGTIRITSIASEPSELGMYLLPIIYLAIARVLDIKIACQYIELKESLIILSASILTFSLIVYIYMIIITIFLLFRYKNIVKVFLGLFFISSISYFSLTNIHSIEDRLNSLNNNSDLLYSNNLSIIAIYSNYLILKHTFHDYWYLGSAIATHSRKYDLYILDFYHKDFGLNKDDAASMPLRLLSELGLIGLITFYSIIFIYIFKIKFSKNTFLQEMFLLSFLLYGLRYGSINTPMFWIFLSGFLNLFYKKVKNE